MLSEASQKFNQYLIEFPELQTQLKSIKSPVDLINLANKEKEIELNKKGLN